MSFSNLFGSGEHLRNLGHFASIVNIATIDGEINEHEQKVLERFARKLNISEDEYTKVLENPNSFPIEPTNSSEERLERLHDLFVIVFSDHDIDDEEKHLIKRYAIVLGFSSATADYVINRSLQIFQGQLSFEDYKYLVNKK